VEEFRERDTQPLTVGGGGGGEGRGGREAVCRRRSVSEGGQDGKREVLEKKPRGKKHAVWAETSRGGEGGRIKRFNSSF